MHIHHPTLLLNENVARGNIRNMVQRAKAHGLQFRPHFKTHQSAYIGKWFRAEGVHKCTVSSVKMAAYFARHGWNDILIAFPVNILAMEEINRLASSIELQLLVSSVEAAGKLAPLVRKKMGVRIEVNTGQNRTGFSSEDHAGIQTVMDLLDRHELLEFTGFYSHPGHTYTSGSREEVIGKYAGVMNICEQLKDRYGSGHPDLHYTIGDTPGCSVAENFGPVTEISPGNFVFYDLMQWKIGSCDPGRIAVAVACPVVGKTGERKEVVIHGGAVHFSKEFLKDSDGRPYYGLVVNEREGGWDGIVENVWLSSIAQEHGLIRSENSTWFDKVKIGDVLTIFPVHSCLTANLMRAYRLTSGEWISGPAGFMP